VAQFDGLIPPGGKGKIALILDLTGYKGNVKKVATVQSNDPSTPQIKLTLQGRVSTFIDILPDKTVLFRGHATSIAPKTIEIIAKKAPFRITGIVSDLEGRVAHELNTIQEGRRYQITLTNLLGSGDYGGHFWVKTDLPQREHIVLRVSGSVEGEVSINPRTLIIGKLSAQQPVRSGEVQAVANSGNRFKITRLAYDETLLEVTPHPLTDKVGYRLEIKPRMENAPRRAQQRATLSVETDLSPESSHEVVIQIMNAQ
jgi:hypothetical protein